MFLGVILGLSASACWSIANVAVQRGTRSVGTFRALFWAQILGALCVAPLLPFETRTVAPTAVHVAWVVGAGAAALVAYVSMFFAFEEGRLTIAVPVMSSWAVIASALSLVLFRETIRPAHLGGAALVIAGAIVVSRFASASTPPTAAGQPGAGRMPRWLLASFGAALGFGLVIPAIGVLSPVTGKIGVIPVIYVADILLGLPLAAYFGVSLAPPSGRAWIPVALAGIFETAGFACIALATHYAPLALVSPLSSLASAFTVFYAWAFLGERPARPVLLGAALVSAGVLTLAL